jgi:hypothetical protein
MDSVASSRLEQYPQLNPYRFPANRGAVTERGIMTPAPAAATAGPAATAPSRTGTRTVVRQTGQRNVWPACPSSADSDARQI